MSSSTNSTRPRNSTTVGVGVGTTNNGDTVVAQAVANVLAWTGTGDWGVIAGNIALWSIISMSAVYLCAGLLLGLRYYNHAQYKSRQQRDRQQRAQALRPGSELGRRTSMTPGLVSLTAQASAAAGGQIYMVGVAVLLPVAFTLIGAIVGFVIGMTTGTLIAGICLYSQVRITDESEIAIGLFISTILLFFSAAPASVNIIFL